MYVIRSQCSDIWALPTAMLWFSAPSWTRPTSHSNDAVKFLILQTKAYVTALANILRTIKGVSGWFNHPAPVIDLSVSSRLGSGRSELTVIERKLIKIYKKKQ